MYAKLKPLTTSKSATKRSKLSHPSKKSSKLLAAERVHRARSEAIAAETNASIDQFEASIGGRVAAVSKQDDGVPTESRPREGQMTDYVTQIKSRVQENLVAREDREKRRRRVLVEQLKAMHEQEVSTCKL